MRLKNKRTGEIGYLYEHSLTQDIIIVYDVKGIVGKYTSLAELNEEWEDYEESKGNWTIDPINEDCIDDGRYTTPDELERYEELGLKFNTREEAELAVRKLKAWKRLKDDGITYSLDEGDGTPYIIIHSKEEKGPVQKVLRVLEDLTLLFGGEE